MKTKLVTSLMLVMAMLLALAGPVLAAPRSNGQETCPDGDGWVKVDGLGGYDYTYTPPAGYHVTQNCYKHGTYVHYGSGPTVSADTHLVCNSQGNCREIRYELSHASFLLEQDEVQPTPTATATEVPHVFSFEIEQFNHCDRWERSIRLLDNGGGASEFVVLDGAAWPGNVSESVSGQTYTGEIDGHPYEVSFEAMGADECDNPEDPTNTPTPTNTTPPDQPTGTPVPTPTPTPIRGCDDPLGRWTLHGVIKDVSGNVLAVPGGNFYHIFFRQVRLEDGVVTAELGTLHFPVFDNGTWGGGGYLPVQNIDRLSVTVMDINGKVYPAQAWSIHSQTKERLADQQQYIGTYCAEMWLEVVISLDGEPLPPPAEQPTPAPIPDTGTAGAAGVVGFGLVLLVVTGVIGLLALSPKKRQ